MNEYAQEKVNGPGIALLALGVVSALVNLGSVIIQLVSSMARIVDAVSNGYGTEFWIPFLTGTGWQIVMSFIGFFVAFVIIFAGMRLRKLRSPAIVYAGSIMAALPCCVGLPCCCIGLPIGIWAIVTLQDEQVKAAFTD